MKTNILHFKKVSVCFVVGIFCVLVSSCSSYQNSSYYNNDGIYGGTYRAPSNNNSSGNQYASYFNSLQDKEDLGDEIFTDVDSYSSQNDSISASYGSWGSTPTSVSVNLYSDYWGGYGWGYPYYGYGYGYGWGYPYYGMGWNMGYGWGLGFGWGYSNWWGYPGWGYSGGGWYYPYRPYNPRAYYGNSHRGNVYYNNSAGRYTNDLSSTRNNLTSRRSSSFVNGTTNLTRRAATVNQNPDLTRRNSAVQTRDYNSSRNYNNNSNYNTPTTTRRSTSPTYTPNRSYTPSVSPGRSMNNSSSGMMRGGSGGSGGGGGRSFGGGRR